MQLRLRSQVTAGVAVVGIGAVAAAIMAAALAPTAHADDPFTDIVTDVDAVLGAGSIDVTNAATDFSTADYDAGLAQTIFGLDDFLVSPEETLLIGSVDALTGSPVFTATDLEWPGSSFVPPTDLSDTLNDLQNFAVAADTAFTTAATDFASGDPADGLLYAVGGVDDLLIGEPEILGIGLTDTVLGGL
jgi:hypothetical protein